MRNLVAAFALGAAVAAGLPVLAHDAATDKGRDMMGHCMNMMVGMSRGGTMGMMDGMMDKRDDRARESRELIAADTVHKGTGKVNKVDPAKGVINLSHGPIKSIGWPSMRMDFAVSDAALLQGIEPGKEVEFEFRQESGGRYVITRIAPLR
jgi:Cu(I)/Ag(I) efflux system protein CusF